ncbi:hypothetical protein [Bacillus pumilus]|uniref:hypothetical protein n=1 Tax=Bacillus pumilus TaxID=1408 RepID=UPI0011A08448|nr:hypothetical protein [Bacillus pumilus]
MFYNFFVSGTGAAGLANSIVAVLKRKFNIVGDVSGLLDSLTTKLKIIYRSFDGKFSWADLGGAILDIGNLILTFVPGTKITKVIEALWEVSTLL